MSNNDAFIDTSENFRYWLKRKWGEKDSFVNFVLLNPSTADEKIDDRTVKSCIARAKRMGFCGIYITNLFAFRTKSPKILKEIGSKRLNREIY